MIHRLILRKQNISYPGVNQDFSKNFVRITIKIPKMKTAIHWRTFTRQAKNGITTEATYHGKYVELFSHAEILYDFVFF